MTKHPTNHAPSVAQARRTRLVRTAAFLLAGAVAIGLPLARAFEHDGNGEQDDHGSASYAIGLWGDLPYSSTQATVGVPNLIADMNAQHLAFTAHDGDIKSGSSECTDSVYTQALGYFNSLRAPAIFTPGDNDWVDCDRTPGYNSLVQLDKERKMFFGTPFTLGQKHFLEEVQSTPQCLGVNGQVPCVENRRWTVNRVTYATLNIQGSCNNRCSTAPDENEYHFRNLANIAWMQDTFAKAKANGSAAVMFISQADPDSTRIHRRVAPCATPKHSWKPTAIPMAFMTS